MKTTCPSKRGSFNDQEKPSRSGPSAAGGIDCVGRPVRYFDGCPAAAVRIRSMSSPMWMMSSLMM